MINKEVIQAYPLQWPVGWKQTEKGKRKRAIFKNNRNPITLFIARKRVIETLLKMKVSQNDVILSTNIPLNASGQPFSIAWNEGNLAEPGACVYWKDKSGQFKCIAIDIYDYVQDNVAAIAATLEAMRAIERHGGAEILNRAFSGFKALPQTGDTSIPSWRDVLELKGKVSIEDVKLQYRAKAKLHHPDTGGDAGAFATLTRAYEMAMEELGG